MIELLLRERSRVTDSPIPVEGATLESLVWASGRWEEEGVGW